MNATDEADELRRKALDIAMRSGIPMADLDALVEAINRLAYLVVRPKEQP